MMGGNELMWCIHCQRNVIGYRSTTTIKVTSFEDSEVREVVRYDISCPLCGGMLECGEVMPEEESDGEPN